MDVQERRLLAYHEGGHALVAFLLPHVDPVHRVTITIDTRTGAVRSSQGAMALRGGQVAVDAVSHHVFVGGPHYGRGTPLAIVSGFVNRALYPVVHRELWVTRSGAATWAVSTVQGTR